MAEMAAAAPAMDRGAADAEGGVFRGADRLPERLPKAWPAGVAVEFGL